jgi:molybdopterin molybdotransferase
MRYLGRRQGGYMHKNGQFDLVLVVDWSANSTPKLGADSIWIGSAGRGAVPPVNLPTRSAAMDALRAQISGAGRVLVAFDIGFGFPTGFAKRLTGQASALAVWDWLATQITDDDRNRNNRFQVAARMNRQFDGLGPFWGCPNGMDMPDLPARGTLRHGHGLAELRETEGLCAGAHPMWKLYTTGSVGSQSLLGQARLAGLRRDLGAELSVWPMQGAQGRIVLAETYLSLVDPMVRQVQGYPCKDAAQVDLLARAFYHTDLTPLLAPQAAQTILQEEGWILGAGFGPLLCASIQQ